MLFSQQTRKTILFASLDAIHTLEDKLDDEQKVVLDELMRRLNRVLPVPIHSRTTADVQGDIALFGLLILSDYAPPPPPPPPPPPARLGHSEHIYYRHVYNIYAQEGLG